MYYVYFTVYLSTYYRDYAEDLEEGIVGRLQTCLCLEC